MKELKAVMKEYLSVKGSARAVITAMLVEVIYFIINARVMIWIAEVVNGAASGDNRRMFVYLNILIIGCIINTLMSYSIAKVMRVNMSKVFTEHCNRFADKVLSVDYDTFTKYSNGKLTTIFNGLGTIGTAGNLLMNIYQSVVEIVVVVVSIGIIEPRLILPIVIIYTIGSFMIKRIWKKISKDDEEIVAARIERNDEINKIIDGFAEVRSSGTESIHMNKIWDMNNNIRAKMIKKISTVSYSSVLFNAIDTVIMLIMILYAIVAISNGVLTTSIAVTLVVYGWRLIRPLEILLDSTDSLSTITSEFMKYKEFMDIENSIEEGSVDLVKFNSSIKFENVSFSYDQSDKILDGLNLTIKKGQKIGLCGHSGGGKSTLIKLIPRLYDTTEGSVLIDGINVKEFTFNSLRRHIGVVHQSNYIFKGSILYNVTYGIGRNVTMDEVIDACKKCCIYDFITSLPEGFNTDVGPNGLKLSGGQQQRIALTRIFLRNPEIIILDEATSALDNESEAIIQDSLKVFKDKTVITIAHRLSTIQDSDKIVVIDEHKVAEEGTHEELIKKNGLYSELWNAKK